MRYCFYDEGVWDFCKVDGEYYIFEAKDFDEADYLRWDIEDKLIDDGYLTNEGTMMVEIIEGEISRELLEESRTIQMRG